MTTEFGTPTAPAPLPQHLAALEKANRIRRERTDLKRRIKHGEVTVATVLRDRPEIVTTMAIGELLRAQYLWRRVRTQKLCSAVGINETKRIGTLTDRQAQLIIDLMGSV